MIRIPSYIFIIGLIGVAGESYLTIARRSNSNAVSKDRNSLLLIWLVNIPAMALGIIAAYKLPAFLIPLPQLCIWLSAGLMIFGFILRWYSIYLLGRFFTTTVAIANDHQLIESGPYRFIRHPSYTGILLAFFGVALCFQNWVAILIMLIPRLIVTLWRIHIEEEALLGAFGDQYRNYMHRTKRLIPWIY
jgi:protein-S-isoprenylcysteine O-methyltransferase